MTTERAQQLEHLAQLTEDMRDLQKTYFQTRTATALQQAKKMERVVDDALRAIKRPQQTQL